MQPALVFPQDALAVWTLCAPLVVAVAEWFITRRQRSELTRPEGRSGYAEVPLGASWVGGRQDSSRRG